MEVLFGSLSYLLGYFNNLLCLNHVSNILFYFVLINILLDILCLACSLSEAFPGLLLLPLAQGAFVPCLYVLFAFYCELLLWAFYL